MKQLRILAVLATFIACATVEPAFANWTKAKPLGAVPRIRSYIAERPTQVVVSGQTVHVVWLIENETGPQISYTRSQDCGNEWSDPVTLAEIPASGQNDVALAVSGDSVHVAWREATDPDGYETATFYARSLDGGDTWTAKTRISLDDQIGFFSPILLQAAGSSVYAVWNAEWRGRARIIVAESTNSGETWSFEVPGAIGASSTVWPAFALAEETRSRPERIYLAFNKSPERKKSMYFRTSSDGSLWTKGVPTLQARPPKFVPRDIDLVWPVALFPERDSVDVLWGHGVAFKYGYISHALFYQRGDVDAWRAKRLINDRRSPEAWDPAFASGRGVVYVAWTSYGDIFVARSKNRGATWKRRRFAEAVSSPRLAGGSPAIAVAPATSGTCQGTTHLVYGRFGGEEPKLLYRRRPAKLR